jgi:hypothetical protein
MIMKFISILFATLCLAPAASWASETWQCDGGNVEGLSVSETQGNLTGFVAWDCFPGGGVCTQNSPVLTSEKEGNTVFQGTGFKLVIETSKAANADGEYSSTISATDMSGSSDTGRGMTIGEKVACKKTQ